MWSDPEDIEDWAINARGAGWVFGSKVTNDFCQINGLSLIARAHQLVQEGYQFWFKVFLLIFRIKIWWQYGQLPTIATDATTWHQSCRWRKTVRLNSKSSRLCLSQWKVYTLRVCCPISCDYNRIHPTILSISSFFHINPWVVLLTNISFRWPGS